MEWFKEEWLQGDHRALGVYLALLRVRFELGWWAEQIPLVIYKELRERLENLIKDKRELLEAYDAGKEFLATLHANEAEKLRINDKSILDEIESDYYETFKRAYLKYLNKDALTGRIADYDVRELVQMFLRDVSKELFGGTRTRAGSIQVDICYHPYNKLCDVYGFSVSEAEEFVRVLYNSGILAWVSKGGIIPAPVLENEFIGVLGEIESKGVKEEPKEIIKVPIELTGKEVELAVEPVKLGEKLEDCVVNVFRHLGFEASKTRVRGRSGVEHEIDVLAKKDLEGLTFRIGVECKNWKNTVGKDVVERYITRWLDCGLNMYIIIAKAFTEDAKRMAKAWGLMPIELGEQARENNLDEITKILLRKFSGLVIGIAKQPLIDSILGRINEMNNELENLRKRLNELMRSLNELADEVRKLS